MKPKTDSIGMFYIKCPGCNSEISFYLSDHITANIESYGKVKDDNMRLLSLSSCCDNPMCKWSDLKW